MTSNRFRRLAAGAVVSFALVGAACGASAAAPEQEAGPQTTDWTLKEGHRPPSWAATETGAATAAVETPVAAETPAPVEEQAEAPAPAEAPQVLWMRTSHAGPGVVTLRFETNVPTTATVSVMTHQVGPTAFFSEDLTVLATLHEISVPAGAPGRYQVRVENTDGAVARAEMRYKSDPQGLDWSTGAAAPKIVAPNSKQLDVTYAFPANHPSKLGLDGSVHIFMADETCTTADSCPGELVGSALDAPAVVNGQLENHKVIAAIPGAAFDYQVIVGQPLNAESSMMVFLQLEIHGDDLPKVKVLGPTDIKSN